MAPPTPRRTISRSAKAWRAGAALKARGATYEEMRAALLEHAEREIAEWAHEKGLTNGERELRRIYERNAARDDGRARLRVPTRDAERLPVMRLLDDILSRAEPEPMMRDLGGWPTEVRCREPMGLHVLTADAAQRQRFSDA